MTVGVSSRASRSVHLAAVIILGLTTMATASCDDDDDAVVGPVGSVGPVGPVGPVDDDDDDDDGIAGSGTTIVEQREIANVDRVVLRGEGTVAVTQGSVESMTIETDDNLIEFIETTVRNGTLEIRTRSGVDIAPTDSVAYNVNVRNLTTIELSGAGTIELASWSTDAAQVRLSGAGDIRVDDLNADSVAIEHSGVGTITIAGTVSEQDVSSSGVGEYEAADLRTRSTRVDARGPAVVTVWATDELDIEVRGPATVEYYGEPNVEQEVRDKGTVTALGLR